MASRPSWVEDFEEHLGILADILPDPFQRAELRALVRHWLALEIVPVARHEDLAGRPTGRP
jgi:hypothetical protein